MNFGQTSGELIRLAALASYEVLDTERDSAYDDIASLAARMVQCEAALILLVGNDRIWVKAAQGLDVSEMSRTGTPCDLVVRSQQPLSLADAAADPRFRNEPGVATAPHLRFYASVPLLTAAGLCLGTLSVFDSRPRAAPLDAFDGLQQLARLVVELLENRRSRALLRRVSQRAARVEQLQAAMAGAPTCEAALTHVLTELCQLHDAAIGRIWKLMLPTDVMLEVCRYQDERLRAFSYFETQPRAPVTAHNSFTAAAIRANKPTTLRYADIESPDAYALVGAAIASGLSSQVSYPIWVQGQHFGIALSFRSDLAPLGDIVADIASLEDLIRPALARKVTEERLLLLATVLDRSGDGVLITDAGPDLADAKIIYANNGFCDLTGYAIDEIIGLSPIILRGPDTDEATMVRVDLAMREWRPIRVELINYRKDGTPFWAELDLAPQTNTDGVITHWVSIRRDITQRRLDASAVARHETLRSVGDLTGGVAHDFNNLLTIVTLNIEEASRRLADDLPLQRLLSPALNASVRGGELVAQMLSYARRAPLRPQLLKLETLMARMQPALRDTLDDRFVLEVEPAHPQIVVQVDADQLEAALTHLVTNAREAMPEGGTIAVRAHLIELAAGSADLHEDMQPGPYLRLSVTDHGHGMSESQRARAFDPFFTTKNVGQGSGLGLSMVYGFARQSGGTADIASTPLAGTTASITLPAGADMADPKPLLRKADPWQAGGRIVLVVEDQPEVLDTVLHLMDHLGFRTLGATTADEAAERLQAGDRFDLLFTDIVLPGSINGLELASLAGEIDPGMRVLITSGFTEHSAPLAAALAGGAELLSKPYKRQNLVDKLKAMFPSL